MRKLIFVLALGAILLPNLGFTLGLGEIEVDSSLNQKLTARIELLSAAPEDAEALIVKLASREEFVRAGLDRPLILTSLKFKTEVADGKVYVNILSAKPIREPFLNFLVEVDWPKGHLIREYTILLDPPVFMGNEQETVSVSDRPGMQQGDSAAPVSVQSSAEVAAFEPVAQVSAAAEAFDEPVQQQARYTAPNGHRVQAGDTAWSIANRLKPDDSVSTEQMLLAMLRTNPEVFINENVNGLKRGYIIRTPDYSDISAVSHEEAKAAVRQQNALWREYQQSLSSDQPASAIDGQDEVSDYSSAVDMNDDSRLSIVSAGQGSSASGEMKDPSEMTADELREQLSLARERVETERVEKENLQQQVGTLTTQVGKMKGLLDVEDDAMAEIQSVDAASDELAVAIDDAGEELFAEEGVVDLADEELALDALDALTGDVDSAVEGEELFVDEVADQAVETEVIVDQEIMEEVEPAFAEPQEASLIDMLLDNRMVVGGLALVLLVLGAIGYLIKRRRSSAESQAEADSAVSRVTEAVAMSDADTLEEVADMIEEESMEDLVSDEEVEASMAEAESEEEFDADATMILPSGTDAEVAPVDDVPAEEEQDDVLAEADVYLAYGIFQQAEELLENAIKENPDKDNYRLKLAETYFAGKNADSFAKLGADMKQRLGDEASPVWDKVAAMGKEICPDNEIFQQASAELDLGDMLPKSPEPMDFDLGDQGNNDSELDLDFDSPLDELDAGELELPSMDETAIIPPAESEELDELEFDLSETDAIEEVPVEEMAEPEEEEFSLDIEASELGLDALSEEAVEEGLDAGLDMDLDMSIDSEPDSVEEVTDDGGLDMDLDLDMSMTDDTEAEIDLTAEAAELDLTEEASEDDLMADLDLSMDDISTADESADLDMSLDDDLGDMDLSEPLDVEEIGTKLDLAKAYLDMGDHEGARDILEEVIAAGNDEQKKEAEELMSQAG